MLKNADGRRSNWCVAIIVGVVMAGAAPAHAQRKLVRRSLPGGVPP